MKYLLKYPLCLLWALIITAFVLCYKTVAFLFIFLYSFKIKMSVWHDWTYDANDNDTVCYGAGDYDPSKCYRNVFCWAFKIKPKEESSTSSELTSEEKEIYDAIIAARVVQDFIWDDDNLLYALNFNAETWARIFQKRVDKIKEVKPNDAHVHWKFELRKRVLQQACLSIIALNVISKIETGKN